MQLPTHQLDSLITIVQRNCAISDAQYAGHYSLCIYLLKMRELYRWEQGIDYDVSIKPDDIGDWLDKREQWWDSLEDEEFQAIEIADKRFDPFDQRSINALLQPAGLVYGAGYGVFAKPSFFLAELASFEVADNYRLYIAGTEYTRDLVAAPAMALDGDIFVRRQSLQRVIWELLDEWRWQTRKSKETEQSDKTSPISQVLSAYQFSEEDIADSLKLIVDSELESVVLHEIGELVAGQYLSNDWNDMLLSVAGTKAEFYVRAVRDLLADCLSVLPALLHDRNWPSIHFYFANFKAMRKELFPTLQTAYQHGVKQQNIDALKSAVRQGQAHWLNMGKQIAVCHQRYGKQAAPRIESLLEASSL